MHEPTLVRTVAEICEKDPRYAQDGYFFLLEALDFTARMLRKPTKEGPERHVSGQELLDGVRTYATQQFGPMTLTVLNRWGIKHTEDFGEIVFNLVKSGRLRKTDEDTKESFANGYDFNEAFAKPFQPKTDLFTKPTLRRPTRKGGKR